MSSKKVVKQFYKLDLGQDKDAISYFHKDCELNWHSSKGFTILNYNNIKEMFDEIEKSFISFRHKLSHLMKDDKTVTARYTIYVIPIEKPDEEIALAHFITIWEVKDGKLYRGYEISQLADNSPLSLKSFSK